MNKIVQKTKSKCFKITGAYYGKENNIVHIIINEGRWSV